MVKQRLTIEGRGQFPIDMLRYEGAYPATGEDAAKIIGTFRRPYVNWKITVERLVERSMDWEMDRWASFNVLGASIG